MCEEILYCVHTYLIYTPFFIPNVYILYISKFNLHVENIHQYVSYVYMAIHVGDTH